MNTAEKPRITKVTDPAIIESIERNQMNDVIGGKDANGNYWAYSGSVARYLQRSSALDQD